MKTLKSILIHITGVILLIFLFQSCRHHINVDNANSNLYIECQPFDETGVDPMRVIDYYQEKTCVSNPCFNPNNSDEFIYFKFVLDANFISKQLVTYNLRTKQEFVVLEDANLSGTVKWAKNNWIVFKNTGAVLYKIKPDGDSLTRLTFCLAHYEPEVSADGKVIIATDRISSESIYRGDKFISFDLMELGLIVFL